MGRAPSSNGAVRMSAEQFAGPKRYGPPRRRSALYWHGSQSGARHVERIAQLRVEKPRLRQGRRVQWGADEVAIPAYDAMQRDQRLAARMVGDSCSNGVSTRRYETVLPAMTEQVGIGKSEVSREHHRGTGRESSRTWPERRLQQGRRVDYLPRRERFGNNHAAAVRVDEDREEVRARRAQRSPLRTDRDDHPARGSRRSRDPPRPTSAVRRRWSEGATLAIAQVFGAGNEVQRCRNHLRNVVATCRTRSTTRRRATLRAAWKLAAKEGVRKLDQYASWLQRDWPDAAASVREGLDEIFTVNRLGLPASLRRASRRRTHRFDALGNPAAHTSRHSTGRTETMALRGSAVAFVETEKNYRRITAARASLDAEGTPGSRRRQHCRVRRSDNLCSPLPLTFYYRWDTSSGMVPPCSGEHVLSPNRGGRAPERANSGSCHLCR